MIQILNTGGELETVNAGRSENTRWLSAKAASSPRDVPENPRGVPGNPGGVPGNPKGVPGNPGCVPSNPRVVPGNSSGVPGKWGIETFKTATSFLFFFNFDKVETPRFQVK